MRDIEGRNASHFFGVRPCFDNDVFWGSDKNIQKTTRFHRFQDVSATALCKAG